MYINQVMLYGNLTRDPELRALQGGGSVASFAIATNRNYKKADGTRAEQTEFHNIVVFGKQGESCAQYLKKGSAVYVEGRIQTRSWESEEHGKQYKTEIIAERVQFGPRPATDGAKRAPDASTGEVVADVVPEATNDRIAYPDEDIDVDAIPF